MEAILDIVKQISDVFTGVATSCEGSGIFNREDLRIPTAADDRRNLEGDGKAVLADLNKAFTEYEAAHIL